jgi:2-methylisocitrate lyase-like PEP mutase family enzyme
VRADRCARDPHHARCLRRLQRPHGRARRRSIIGCFDLPTMADADTGYGNAVNVHFTVRGFEQAGVSGIMIEDQVWPKRCGHMKGKAVISAEEAADKIRAAAEARRDPEFVVMSRTDALATHGLDEVIRRLNLYAEAGADGRVIRFDGRELEE